MIICMGLRASDRDITRMSRSGASFADLQLELGVATQCRACESCARDLHAQCQSSGALALVASMRLITTSHLKPLPRQAA